LDSFGLVFCASVVWLELMACRRFSYGSLQDDDVA